MSCLLCIHCVLCFANILYSFTCDYFVCSYGLLCVMLIPISCLCFLCMLWVLFLCECFVCLYCVLCLLPLFCVQFPANIVFGFREYFVSYFLLILCDRILEEIVCSVSSEYCVFFPFAIIFFLVFENIFCFVSYEYCTFCSDDCVLFLSNIVF